MKNKIAKFPYKFMVCMSMDDGTDNCEACPLHELCGFDEKAAESLAKELVESGKLNID